jgi:hypothetical protein
MQTVPRIYEQLIIFVLRGNENWLMDARIKCKVIALQVKSLLGRMF